MLNLQLTLLSALYGNGVKQGAGLFLIHAGYLLLAGLMFFIARDLNDAPFQIASTVFLIAGAAFAWHLSHKRYRTIADTPTALLRSAAQGYVELFGRARLMSGAQPLVYGQLPPCLWYRVVAMENTGLSRHKLQIRSTVSEDLFLIDDGSGQCVIDPEHAEVLGARTWRWRSGDDVYHAQYLGTGDPLYVIGDLRTLRGADGTLDPKADIVALLRQWKTNRQALLQRFDANSDGDIDMQEWQQVVAAAGHAVAGKHRQLREQPDVHLIRQPNDRRPFLLASRDPQALAQRFRYWSWFHALVFLAASGYAALQFGR